MRRFAVVSLSVVVLVAASVGAAGPAAAQSLPPGTVLLGPAAGAPAC